MSFVRYFKWIVPLQIVIAILNLIVLLILFIAMRLDAPPPGLNNDSSGNNGTIPNSSNNGTTPNSSNQPTTTTNLPGGLPDVLSSRAEEGAFLTYEQMAISILVVVGCAVSLLVPYRLMSNYRFSMVWVISIAGLVVGTSQFIMIGLRGGCSVPYYYEKESRCAVQLGVSSVHVLWVLLLITEGMLSYQRSTNKDFLTRMREQDEEGSERWRWSVTSVVYNPDLAQQENLQRQQLEDEREEAARAAAAASTGEESERSGVEENVEEGSIAPAIAGGQQLTGRQSRARRTSVVQAPIEMEPLPMYKLKPARGQPRIIDLGNMPLPPTSLSTLSRPASPAESYVEGALSSLSTTGTGTNSGEIQLSTGAAETGTTETGTETGALDNIPSSLPPSYSA